MTVPPAAPGDQRGATVDPVARAVAQAVASARITRDVTQRELRALQGEENPSAAVARARRYLENTRDTLVVARSASVLLPTSLAGLYMGNGIPDTDIATLGIGRHRYFLFHSAVSAVILRRLHRAYLERTLAADRGSPRVRDKAVGGLLALMSAGVGLHLIIDVFQPKSIVFPFFGSLVDGTLVDDRLWLLGNSLYCFRCARDIFVLSYGDDMRRIERMRERHYGPLVEAEVR